MRNGFMWVSLAWLALALGGCPDDGPSEIALSCDLPFTAADIKGLWSLHATGQRTGCSDRRYGGELEISSEQPLHITGKEVPPKVSTNTSDAFVDRITERSVFNLGGKSLPARITFGGASEGSCVTFQLIEDLGHGDQLSYAFEGQISEEGSIEGNFTGTGPGDCRSHGTFSVDVR